MGMYEGNYSLELDYFELQIKKDLDDFTKDWSTDEMIELLVECEFALSYCEGRIDQLKAKGLKRLVRVITGINRKNEQSLREGTYEVQKITFRIQKILMKRINLVSFALCSLEDRIEQEISWTQDTINNLLDKLENVPKKTDLLWLANTIRNMEMKSGKKYIEAADGIKILLVVSELFKIVHDQTGLFDKPFLETILKDKMNLNKKINVWKFYGDVIYNKECISLYVKDEYAYSTAKISQYGKMIYKINGFYSSPYTIEIANSTKQSLEDMCIKTYSEQIQKENKGISTFDLCLLLLKDLADLDSEYRRRIETEESQYDKICEEIKKTEEKRRKIQPISSNILAGFNENPKQENKNMEYSILRLTPEGRWWFKNNNVDCTKLKHGDDYSFLNEEEVKGVLERDRPYIVTAPTGYFEKCMLDIKSFLSNKAKYISLADYYMYLWFEYTNKDERKSKRVAFIEYYAHMMCVSAYVVHKSGNSYQKEPKKADIPYNKLKEHIKEYIMSLPPFLGLDWESILIFKTFTAERYIDKKLLKMGVKMVDNIWEDMLKVDNEELGKIISDMMGKQ